MNTEMLPVSFHGDTVYLTETGAGPTVPIRPIVENLGLAWQPQHKKLTSNPKRWGVIMIVTPSPGGDQNTLCLPLRKLPAFLYSIEPRKVRPDIRPKLELYQELCDDALWRHWSGQHQAAAPAAPAPAPEPPEVESVPLAKYAALLEEHVALLKRPRAARRNSRPQVLRPLTQAEIEEMRRLARAGLSTRQVARRVGRSHSTVRLAALGVLNPAKGGAR